MSNSLSSLEPPPVCACYVDIECHYADVTVPGNTELVRWVKQTIQFLNKTDLLENCSIELAIVIVEKTESQLLNAEYRQQDYPTNVLSFPFDTPDIFKQHQQTNILGDIVICAPVIELESQQQNKTFQQHWAHMVVHGVLHLLGYDHINSRDAQIMESLEIKILDQLGYQNPYMESSL